MLFLSNTSLPVLCAVDSRTAAEPFYHADRVLDFCVLIYVTEGVIYVTEDGTDYEIGEGSLLFLENGLRHFGRTEIPMGTKWIFVHFYPCAGGLRAAQPDTSDIGVYERLESCIPLPKQLFGLKGTPLERQLIRLESFSHSADCYKRFKLNRMLSEVLESAALNERPEPSLADRTAEYLALHCGEPFSSEKLEREFYLSYKRLAAVFKAEKGVPMQRYHSSLRLAEAARLLRTTALSVAEVAERTGFSDPLYFSRCFREEYSLPPREYRRKMIGRY